MGKLCRALLVGGLALGGCAKNLEDATSNTNSDGQINVSATYSNCTEVQAAWTAEVSKLTTCQADTDCTYIQASAGSVPFIVISRSATGSLQMGCGDFPATRGLATFEIGNGQMMKNSESSISSLLSQATTLCPATATCNAIFGLNPSPPPVCRNHVCVSP